MVGVKGRSGSGGRRSGSGRSRKIYKPIILDYKPDSPKNVRRSLTDLYCWVIEDKIERGKAATAAHILEIIAKFMFSTEKNLDDDVNPEIPEDEFDQITREMNGRAAGKAGSTAS